MLLTRVRVKPAATIAVQKPSVSAAPRRMRVNATTERNDMQATREKLDALLQLIARKEAELDIVQADLDAAHKATEALMREAKLNVHSHGNLTALIEQTFSRQSRSIDPKKFRNAVSDAVFWSSIDVSVTKAARHMAPLELARIADTIPGKSTGFVFRLKRKKGT